MAFLIPVPCLRSLFLAWVTLAVVLSAGCSSAPKPGVTYTYSLLEKKDGNIHVKSALQKVVSATVATEKTITHDGVSLSLLIKKTEFGKVTFDIRFPGMDPQRVRIVTGETKDIFPEESPWGIRIDVLECH